ncbi:MULTISPECIES: hypothetical protein [unclassified Variovorax]|uniref:hypothetical protein n=1 Tax=unclassified Variovorax TaxID=663243 RepID=UPI0008AF5C79|nr:MULTISPECIES: hypothetical protein [unclassified Variovorax]SEK17257.1 PRTase ComF-like [Variovorax sp. OK202]SFE76350.1 PRTase ComF-like [Variovorax sp. OK212]
MTLLSSIAVRSWTEMLQAPDEIQLALFRQATVRPYSGDVKIGFRAFAADLLARGLIDMGDYVTILGGTALVCLEPGPQGRFQDMRTGHDASELAAIYSRAKYGGVDDIRYLARGLVNYLHAELDDPCSQWTALFRDAKAGGDCVVMMTTGWRNVPSTANVLYDKVVEAVNLKLAHLALPTIINVKLPRLAPPCEHYASLSLEEREQVNLLQDHVIPGENFYRSSGVHVIFGDDVLVTGSTADKVQRESLSNGAKSFRALYPVAIDPRVALTDATVEDRLNRVVITHQLDDTLAQLLSDPGYQPILRTLRLVFGEGNRDELATFLPKVPASAWLSLYKAALGNEFLAQVQCVPSLVILRSHLTKLGLLDEVGRAPL